jgi:hypothetical protein
LATFTLAGSGTQAISSPSSLLVTITTPPSIARRGRGNPASYFDVGFLTPGDASGWYSALVVSESPQHLPLPASCTVLGYGLLTGAVLSVAEVFPPTLSSQLMPWDRNPTVLALEGENVYAGGTAATQQWTYTVPAGRKFWIATMQCVVQRQTPPTTPGGTNAYISVGGVRLLQAYEYGGAQGLVDNAIGQGAEMVLPPGAVITGNVSNADTGGACVLSTRASGFTFDA